MASVTHASLISQSLMAVTGGRHWLVLMGVVVVGFVLVVVVLMAVLLSRP